MASEAVRVAFVAEGPTDFIALRAAVRALLRGRDFVLNMIQPEVNENLVPQGHGGWGGVYRWCRQAVAQANGPIRENPIFVFHDVIVIHVDADVANKSYKGYELKDAPDDLPCQQPCPSAQATTDALRGVLLGWMNEKCVPPGAVLCTPSKSIETWVLAALAPNDFESGTDVECQWKIEKKLKKYGLVKGLKKKVSIEYLAKEQQIEKAWPEVRTICAEAERFSKEFLAQLPSN